MIRFSQDRTARADGAAPVAPPGGARQFGGWGCGYLVALLLTTNPAHAVEVFPVPSGQDVTLTEVLLDSDPGELWVRFRFVAPAITRDTGSVSYDLAGPDMDYLCDALALPYLTSHEITPARVVISLMDRPVAFGALDADATQFFESYTPDGNRCIWEEF
ncbi:hypothetical protein FEE96_19605 [Parasedimentitalea maritima]|uniref:Acetolactate synthase n=1 Tax=Parasedimentitalea maritima TaxID=2578117 RepID=A0ABY2UVP6_9RHOB|nr:DUF6497 family protein [Zongyanglinia marina]TLP57585.1 hypothetical protein FEE96_19605 [Zongyanglinia marina]